MDNLSGTTIKGYEMRERIGAGGFGAVYLAFQQIIEREVAVKVILPQFANQPEFIRNFEAEAQTVARLEHPYIIPLFDYWREPDRAYLVMRYLRGGSLTDRLKDGPIPPDKLVIMIEQITAALATAHRAGVVHRDLKPDNILLDEEDNAFLTDFGIAKIVGHNPTSDSVSGSLRYMAPEQLQSAPPTPQGDLYSLGVMIYEMLTGHHPFEGASPSQLITNHLNDPLPNILDVWPDAPDTLNDVLEKATAKDPTQRYEDIRRIAVDLKHSLSRTDGPAISASWESAAEIDVFNPYKGLRAFQEADAADFFGRESLVNHLMNRMTDDDDLNRFLAVVGPSGSGKSSVVRAGLTPALRDGKLSGSEDWFIVDMVPGSQPLRQLENVLLSVALRPPSRLYELLTADEGGLLWGVDRVLADVDGDMLLIIDQFEELFTMVDDEDERAHFLNLLRVALTAPDTRLRVIVTLRADFTDRPLEYVEFGELIRRRTEFVLPLSAEEIERAITGPATRAGLQVDTDLIAAIVADVREEPGALPLLQYALTEVFERRDGRRLTLAGYQEIGGVLGALARRAEEVFVSLDEAQKVAARQIFLRMVTLGEGTEDTRRRARRSELAEVIPDSQMLQSVLDAYGQFRLLTFDVDSETREPMVEVAHEALIREWSRLRGWLDDSRSDLRLQRVLAGEANEWKKSGGDPSFLLSGARLVQYEEWLESTNLALTVAEREYLEASIAERARLTVAEQERKAREEETARRAEQFAQRAKQLRRAATVLAAVFVLAVIATFILISQVASTQAEVASGQTEIAAVEPTLGAANTQIAGVEPTLVAAQVQISGAETEIAAVEPTLAAGQTQIAGVEPTLAAADQRIVGAETQIAEAEINATAAWEQVEIAEAQVAGFEPTVAAAETQIAGVEPTLAAAQAEIDALFPTLDAAQTQVAGVEPTLDAADERISQAELLVVIAERTLGAGEVQIAAAETQVAGVEPTLQAAQAEIDLLVPTIDAAQTQVAGVDPALDAANLRVAGAETQVAGVEPTLQAAQAEIDALIPTLDAAETQVAGVDPTLDAANLRVAAAETQVAGVEPTLQAAQAEIDELVPTIDAAQTQVAGVDPTLDAANLRVAGAETQIAGVEPTLQAAQAEIDSLVPTLDTAQTQVAGVEPTLAAAETQVAGVEPTLDAANLRVAGAETQVAGVEPTLDAAQAQIDSLVPTLDAGQTLIAAVEPTLQAAQAQLAGVEPTLDAAETQIAGVEPTLQFVEIEVREQREIANALRLVRSAEQLLNVGNPDLAIALVLEAYKLSPSLGETQRLLNDAIPLTVRLNFSSAREGLFSAGDRFLALSVGTQIEIWDPQGRLLLHEINTSSGVSTLEFSRDGQRIYIGTNNGQIAAWDAGTGQQIFQYSTGHRGAITDISINSAETRMITGGSDRTARLWDIVNGVQLGVLDEFETSVKRVVYNAPGTEAYAFDLHDRQPRVGVFSGDTTSFYRSPPRYRGISPNGQVGYTGADGSGFLRFWVAHTGVEIRPFQRGNANQDYINQIAYSQDGRFIMVHVESRSYSTRDEYRVIGRHVAFWSLEGAELLRLQTGQEDPNAWDVHSLAISPDGRYALTGARFGRIHLVTLWDVATGQEVRRFAGHGTNISNVEFSPNGSYAISRSANNNMRVWDVGADDRNIITTVNIRAEEPGAFGFSADGETIYTAFNNRSLASYSIAEDREIPNTRFSTGTQQLVVFSPVAPLAFVVATDNVTLWNMETRQFVHRFTDLNPSQVRTAAFSQDGSELFIGGQFATIRWDIETRSIINRTSLTGVSQSLQVSDNGEYLLGASTSTINLFDLVLNRSLQTFNASGIRTAALSPDLNTIAAGLDEPENSVLLMDGRTGETIFTMIGHAAGINDVKFSADGLTLISASDDGTLILWDVATGQLIRQYAEHTAPVQQVEFSPAGRLAFSRSTLIADGLIGWRVESAQETVNRTYNSRYVLEISCQQRQQYGVEPFCENGIVPTPQPTPTPQATATQTPTSTPRPTLTPTHTPVPMGTIFTADGANVNVRADAGPGFALVTQVAPGTRVEIIQIREEIGWAQIRLPDGTVGWVLRGVIR